MPRYTFLLLTIALSFISGLLAGPERYDHLEKFKTKLVTEDGPGEEIVRDDKGEQIARAVYKYNASRQISQIDFFSNGKSDGKNIFIYDEKGLKQEELFNKDNKLIEKLVYTRDSSGNVIEFEVFDENNVSIVKWKFQYKNGRMVSGTRTIENEVSERFTYEYGDKTITQGIFVDNNENAGSIVAYMETPAENTGKTENKPRVIKRVKTDYTGTFIIEYNYDKQGRLEKMIFSVQEENSEPKIQKVHVFLYSMPSGPGARIGMNLN